MHGMQRRAVATALQHPPLHGGSWGTPYLHRDSGSLTRESPPGIPGGCTEDSSSLSLQVHPTGPCQPFPLGDDQRPSAFVFPPCGMCGIPRGRAQRRDVAVTPQPSPFPPTPVLPVHPAPLSVALSRAGMMPPTLPWRLGFHQHLWGSSSPSPPGGLHSAALLCSPTPHNRDNSARKAGNGREGKWLVFNLWRAARGAGAGVVGGRERSAPPAHAAARCPPELSAPITALNGRGRPPAQGAFIPLDGNQEKWENAELRVLRSPLAGDVSVSDFTGSQRRGQRPPGWERLFLPHGPFPGLETLSPGPCCRMSHRAGIRACNGPRFHPAIPGSECC